MIRSGAALLLVLFGTVPVPAAAPVAVAAASNLAPVLEPLRAAFGRRHPAVPLTLSVGASGSLHAQMAARNATR